MNLNQLWGELIIDELVKHGIQCFCISPGSRSTPLTLAAAKNKQAKSTVFFDERSAAYFALGNARGNSKPAILICTSGTAAANYFPAVIESSVEQIPMLVLTADRPPELKDNGANQSINQTNLFGRYTRWYFDPGCPDPNIKLEALLSSVDYAIYRTTHPLPGPVHINLQFREPFFKETKYIDLSNLKKISKKNIHVKYSISENSLSNKDVKHLLDTRPESGILSIGRVPKESLPHLRKLAKELAWPVFADIASGLRLGRNCPNRVTYYDQLLLKNLEESKLPIDAVWHIGFPPTSKRWLKLWEHIPTKKMVWITDNCERLDPSHNFSWRIEIGINNFCKEVLNELSLNKNSKCLNEKTLVWFEAEKKIKNNLEKYFFLNYKEGEINDFSLSRKLTEIIPKDHGFFIGNSIPVRAVNSFGSGTGSDIPVALNRGASGIDGLIASACGYSLGLKRAVTLLIGDLSAFHDLNSFKIIAESKYPIVIVLINNHGGGIFSLLPISQKTDIFDNFFGTLHQFNFKSIAKMFNLNYFNPKSIYDFELHYKISIKEKTSTIIEVFTELKDIPTELNDIQKKL